MRKGPELFWLGLALAVVVASMVLTPGPEAVSLFGFELPGMCTFRRVFGISCPGCGLTRSFVYMGHLQVREAFEMHVIGPVFYAFTAGQVPYRAWRLLRAGPAPRTA